MFGKPMLLSLLVLLIFSINLAPVVHPLLFTFAVSPDSVLSKSKTTDPCETFTGVDVKKASIVQPVTNPDVLNLKMITCALLPVSGPPSQNCISWGWKLDTDNNPNTGIQENGLGYDKVVIVVGNGGTCADFFPMGYSLWLASCGPPCT